MTEEKVKKGEELLKHLSKLKDQKSRWEKAECFFRLEVADRKEYNGRQNTFSVDDSFINFEEIKLLAIAKISRRIEQVQREFDEL